MTGHKIIPDDYGTKPIEENVTELRQFLAANVSVNVEDGNLDKAAAFQRHLDTVEKLYEHSRDRIEGILL